MCLYTVDEIKRSRSMPNSENEVTGKMVKLNPLAKG